MRIVCDTCGAKYSIPDEKVQGKVFKVRCKKCTNVILVDPTVAQPADDDAARVTGSHASPQPEDAAVWYAVIDGAQAGPMSMGEFEAQASIGAVDRETFAWRDGMADWLRVSEIPELARLLRQPAAAVAVAAPEPVAQVAPAAYEPAPKPVAAAEAPTFATGTVALGALQVEASPALEATPAEPPAAHEPEPAVASEQAAPASWSASSPAQGEEPGGLFAAFAASPTPEPSTARDASSSLFASASSAGPTAIADSPQGGGFGDFFASSKLTAEPAAEEPKLVAERSENSVLFSLSDLTKTTTPAPRSSDLKRTEGSGLIDIRLLASSSSSATPFADAGPVPPLLATPSIPLPPRKKGNSLMVLVVAGSVVVLALVGAIVFMLTRPPVPGPASNPPGQPPAAPPVAEVVPPAPPAVPPAPPVEPVPAALPIEASGAGSAPAAVAPPSEPPPAQVQPSGQQAEAPRGRDGAEPARPATPARPSTVAPGSPTAPPAAQPAPAPTRPEPARPSAPQPPAGGTPPPAAGGDRVASVLDSIRGGRPASAAPSSPSAPAAAAPTVPETLSREDVTGTIRRYSSRVSQCKSTPESAGTFRISFVIQNSGSVSNVSPVEPNDTSRCIADVVSAMTFPRFSGKTIPVTYPFVIR